MSPKDITPKAYFKKVFLYSGILFAIVSTLVFYYVKGERDKDAQQIKNDSIEERIPEDVTTFVEWEKHMNEKPSDVETHILNRRNKEIGDSLLILSKKQDAQQIVITEQLKVIDTFRVFLKEKASIDSIAEIDKQVSRDKRTDDMEVQTATMLLILKKVNELEEQDEE
jgi:hypothetical protein